jgi:membrane protein
MLGQAAWHALVSFYNSEDPTYATSIAYYALLSLFPFFLLVFSLLGGFAADEADRATVLDLVLRYVPGHLDFVAVQLDGMRASRFQLGIAGFGLMTWATLGVFGAVTSAVDHAWGVERQRSFLKHKLVSFSMLAAAGVLILVVVLLVSTVGMVESTRFGATVAQIPGILVVRGLAVRSSATVLLIFVVGLIFYFVPNAKVRFRDVWMGAALTGVLWRLALAAFQWYVRDLSRLTVIHGSIAAVVVFLLWIYVSAVILLYGVEFTAAYARLTRHLSDDVPAAPSPRT